MWYFRLEIIKMLNSLIALIRISLKSYNLALILEQLIKNLPLDEL
jgi:hypothetical protein